MKKLLPLLLLYLTSTISLGQSYKIMQSASGVIEQFNAIYDNEENLFGYVELLKMEQESKETMVFKYIVLDKNMNTVCSGNLKENIVKRRCQKINYDISYNNGHIMFSFFERLGKSDRVRCSYQILKIDTNTIVANAFFDEFVKTQTSIKKLIKNYKSYQITGLGKEGFLIRSENYNPWHTPKLYYYAINFKGEKIWEQAYKTPEKKRFYYRYKLIDNDNKYVVLLAAKYRRKNKKSDNLLILDAKTGTQIAFTNLYNKKYSLTYENIKIKDDKIYIVGRFFKKEAHDLLIDNESLGLYQRIVNLKDGSIISDKFLDYDKFNGLDITKKGKVRGDGYLNFTKIEMNPDGSYFLLGETYGSYTLGFYYYGLYSFNINKDFNMEKIYTFDTKRSIGTKYVFSQTLLNKSGKVYFFFDKNEEKEPELNILNFNYANKESVVEKIKITNKDSEIKIIPAKPGYVGIVEIFKDPKEGEKALELRLEKLNYKR
ncbi:conserved exported hypothetical protein [Flavobacterium psychrophilum]|uniref:DUF6770 family protein n=1 Tax=Flavobacterium psychrophilum TaxID=96345 RepID=UPI000B7C3938|nr:DUF6770 family protein [Flavobacterium psychrophilum]SNB27083.1 conserved exported hypothetical protein [Flavobacterium psychrophilum]